MRGDVSSQGVVVVGPAFFNWSETHRMVLVGRQLLERGYHVVMLGSGLYEKLVKNAGFERITPTADEWWFTASRIKDMMDLDRVGNAYASVAEIEAITAEEAAIIRECSPVAVVTGYRTTLSVSARRADVPLVWCLSAVVSPMYFEQGLATPPEQRDLGHFLTDTVPESMRARMAQRFVDRYALSTCQTSGEWNQCLRAHGLPLLKSDMDIFRGDLNLMTDARELFPSFDGARDDYAFCGPIMGQSAIEPPECLRRYRKTDRPVVFVSMGSSGDPGVLLGTLAALRRLDCEVFASTTSIVALDAARDLPANFHLAEAFPMSEILDIADVCVIHGGQGTLYAVLSAGKPFVGVPMFNEQQYNLENVVRHADCGIVVRRQTSPPEIVSAVERVVAEPRFAVAAAGLRRTLAKYQDDASLHGDRIAADLIVKRFGGRTPGRQEVPS